jgi:hypothetical protein
MQFGRACTICRTTMALTDRQLFDDQYETVFFKCPMCGSSAQVVMAAEGARNSEKMRCFQNTRVGPPRRALA